MKYFKIRSKKQLFLGVSGLLFVTVLACQTKLDTEPKPNLPTSSSTGIIYQTTSVKLRQPSNFPAMVYDLSTNPLTAEGIALGKSLFYDRKLSRDSTVSCGFCHQQFAGFAHSDHLLSHGIDDKFGTRNVPGLQNLGWSQAFFWDGGINNLDELSISPIQNSVEMDLKLSVAVDRVRKNPKYPALFKATFGSDTITTVHFLKAISQFLLTLVSADSKYDKYIRKEIGGNFSPDEQAGLTLFKQKCASCHNTDLFTDQSYRNNGLPVSSGIQDQGRYNVTFNDADRLKFKVPSLRNVAYTFPYMHDGRFASLEHVLEFYRKGVTNNPTLDPLLKTNGQIGIVLTDLEGKQIISFLHTLTDSTFTKNRAFSDN